MLAIDKTLDSAPYPSRPNTAFSATCCTSPTTMKYIFANATASPPRPALRATSAFAASDAPPSAAAFSAFTDSVALIVGSDGLDRAEAFDQTPVPMAEDRPDDPRNER